MQHQNANAFVRLAGAAALSLGLVTPGLADPVEATRARIETVSLHVTAEGERQCWARYSTNSGQARSGVIEEVAFRVPCPENLTQDFIASLQRALTARGYYSGPITGKADPNTRAAVQEFQRSNGFNSPILTLETARRLGLAPIEISRN